MLRDYMGWFKFQVHLVLVNDGAVAHILAGYAK